MIARQSPSMRKTRRAKRCVDATAYEQVTRKWALPPCLHVPIVAKDQAAIEDHIGEVVQVISPGKALRVRCDPPEPPEERLPIFSHPNVSTLFARDQVWVSPGYTRYRQAWRKTLANCNQCAIRGDSYTVWTAK